MMLNYDAAWCAYYDAKKASRDAIRFPEAPATYTEYEGWFYEEWASSVREFEESHARWASNVKADPQVGGGRVRS